MAKSKNETVSSFGSLTTLVFIVFLVLKLAGIGAVATWSWWWVTAPLWGGVVLVLGIMILAILFQVIAALFK